MNSRQQHLIEEIYVKWHAELTAWCSIMTSDPGIAEELVQEAFMKAMLHMPLIELLGEKQRRAWLYRTVKNGFIDHCRKRSREEITSEMQETEAAAEGVSEYEWRHLLSETLTEQEMTLFRMRYIEGFHASELAERFKMPAGTIRYRLSETRKKLRDALDL